MGGPYAAALAAFAVFADLRQVVQADALRERRARQQVADLERERGAMPVAARHQVAHLVVDADREARVDVRVVAQRAHADECQVEVVDRRALHRPVDAARHELRATQHALFNNNDNDNDNNTLYLVITIMIMIIKRFIKR